MSYPASPAPRSTISSVRSHGSAGSRGLLQSSKCAAGATAALPINASLYDKLNFDFVRDFAPVAGIMRVPNVMEVHPSVPAKTVIISDKSCDYHGAANSLRPRAVRGRPPRGGVQHKTAFGAPLLPGGPQSHGGTSGEPTDRTQE